MKLKWITLTLGISLLCACGKEKKPQETEPTKAQTSKTKTSPQDSAQSELVLLNQQNYEQILREYFEANKARKFKLTTRIGTIKVRLYDDTPLHTANFLMLIDKEYLNNTEFTRVVKNFVVQGGNNDNEYEEIKRILIGSYLIDAEFQEKHIHKRGAIAMARSYTENPEKRSSAYDFYFVQGQTLNEPQLMAIERDNEIQIHQWKREVYGSIGGAPHLDGEHTVFGEIYEGLDVLEKMSLVETDESHWPLDPLVMEVELIND